jgi:hypothetical protein
MALSEEGPDASRSATAPTRPTMRILPRCKGNMVAPFLSL